MSLPDHVHLLRTYRKVNKICFDIAHVMVIYITDIFILKTVVSKKRKKNYITRRLMVSDTKVLKYNISAINNSKWLK